MRRPHIEETPSVDALQYAHEHGTPTRERRTPTGEVFAVALCPQCERETRRLFLLEGVTACRKCHRLDYARNRQRGTRAERLRKNPRAIGEALGELSTAMQTSDRQKFAQALTTLGAAEQVPPGLWPQIQAKIVEEDLRDTTALMQIVKAQIASQEENHVNRRGEFSRVPLRVDSLLKLVNAYATLANVRATRAGLATAVFGQQSEEKRENIGELLAVQMKQSGHRAREGYTLEELESLEAGEIIYSTPSKPDDF